MIIDKFYVGTIKYFFSCMGNPKCEASAIYTKIIYSDQTPIYD